jgi:hypothetical protein
LTQSVSAGASSLRKMPRYCTFGASLTEALAEAYTLVCFAAGTSAHQFHGETPICSDIS